MIVCVDRLCAHWTMRPRAMGFDNCSFPGTIQQQHFAEVMSQSLFCILVLLYCSVRALLMSDISSILSTETRSCIGFDLIPALRLVWTGGGRGRKHASDACPVMYQKLQLIDTHNNLNDVNELRYQRKHLYYFQEIQQRSRSD